MSYTLHEGDCLEIMKSIPDNSIDLCLTDPPYGTTACKWDSIIPLEPMWDHLKRIVKRNGAIVMTSSQPFTTKLIASNYNMFKYCWVWDKVVPSGMSYARFQPMRRHEDIIIFGDKIKYNPQMKDRQTPIKSGGMTKGETTNNKNLKPLGKSYEQKNPTTILNFIKIRKGSLHPTQKPVALMTYLIKTYTDPGETVLDFAFGSCTTGIACLNTGMKFIGIEKDSEYFQLGKSRMENHIIQRKEEARQLSMQTKLFL